jgi:2-isopropylmalate synthase
MATSCVFTSITCGADQIKVASIKGCYPTLESVAHVFHFRGNDIGIVSGLDLTGIKRAINRMSWLKGGKAKVNMGTAAVTDNDILSDDFIIPQDADQAAVEGYVTQLGYELSEEDMGKVYDAYKRIAAHKTVKSADLDIIIANAANQVPATYTVKDFVINSGNTISATANINLEKDGQILNGLAVGDGPIDAAFRAFEAILGHHYELDDFRISSVTEGREAMGKAFIKLRNDGRLYSGQGISTDIIEASIRAYVAAINKIVYEEDNI